MSCAEIHDEKQAEDWAEGQGFHDEVRLVGQSDERCRERLAERVRVLVEEKASTKVRVNWSVGLDELSGEQSEENPNELPTLRFTIDDVRLSIAARKGHRLFA